MDCLSSRNGSPAFLETEPRNRLTAAQRAILLTVVYADLFDFALTLDELCARLVGLRADREQIGDALAAIDGRLVTFREGHVVLSGREGLLELRRSRQKTAAVLWPAARRYARWLACIPFVKMVAVSGSLAVGNTSRASDIDFFCITEAKRLWVARLFIVPLSKLTRLLPGVYLCPNYLLARNGLRLEDRNLFTAHEIVQAVPIWGDRLFLEFRSRNSWIRDWLPNARFSRVDRRMISGIAPVDRTIAEIAERLLAGRAGDALNEISFRVFTWFYRRRAERRGWDWGRLAPAYGRDRYVVPEGGYAAVVGQLFRQRVRRLGLEPPPSGDVSTERGGSVYDWDILFEREYGHE